MAMSSGEMESFPVLLTELIYVYKIFWGHQCKLNKMDSVRNHITA